MCAMDKTRWLGVAVVALFCFLLLLFPARIQESNFRSNKH